MRTVKIIYNPYTEDTRLVVDGVEHKDGKNRVDHFIVGKPMSHWISAYYESYCRWEGLLPELMAELNDDELNFQFCGIPEHFGLLQSELERQASFVEEKGYSSSAWTIQMKECFSLERVRECVLEFIQKKAGYAPDQHSLIAFECLQENIMEHEILDIEALRDIRGEILSAVRAAADYCKSMQSERNMDVKIKFWRDAERELEFAYEGGMKWR